MGRKNKRLEIDTALPKDLLRPMASKPEWSCSTGYAQFPTEERAWLAVDSYVQDHGEAEILPSNVYKCPECKNYHMAAEWQDDEDSLV